MTKGDLLRYYAEVSPLILPCVEDRPLVMKRFPNGVGGKAFYQQRSREERPPAGVRIETLDDSLDPIGEPDAKRHIGGSLTTLLYMTQMAAISQDPWFSRVQSPLDMDHCAIDLDPTDGATFDKVLDVARWVRDELVSLGVTGFPKTSGASGLHIYIPLPPDTSYESGQLFCQIVATVVASRHPKVATVERMVEAAPARHRVCGLPAEHPGQDAGDRLQRPRERLRGRLDAADLERSGWPARSARLHDPHGAGAVQGRRGSVEGRSAGRRSPQTSRRCSSKYSKRPGRRSLSEGGLERCRRRPLVLDVVVVLILGHVVELVLLRGAPAELLVRIPPIRSASRSRLSAMWTSSAARSKPSAV